MTYDKAGRKLTMNDPNMGVWSYAYDALGNLTSQTDARGCVLTLTYDDLSRLDAKSSSGTCGQQINVNYDYDSTADGNKGIGRRTSMSDGSGSTAWKYDTRGRPTRETKTITGHSAFVTEFAYNSADLPTSMTYPDGEVVNYEYNARMMLDTVIGNSTYVSDTQYDSAGRMTSRSLGNGLTQTFGYYDWNEKVNNIGQGGRLESLVTGSLQNLSYVYDKVGNVKQITNSIADETSVYGYDELNRLTSWQLNQNPVENYSYDSAGNLDVKNGLDLEYDDANHVHAVTSAGVNTYSYDNNGNQTTRNVGGQTVQLDYDAENRLVSVTGTNLTAQFYYNGDGQRVKSVVNNETVYFAGGHFEFNDTTDEVTKHYFAGASRIAVRKYIVPQSTTLNYLLGDHLGSTSVVTNETGALVVETRYKPWGEVRYTTENLTLPTRYTFTGQYSHMSDDATDLGAAGFGLMFYNARWYDPQVGRFAQADTIVPGGLQGLDRYAYVGNNPVNYIDPSGHETTLCDETCEEELDKPQYTLDDMAKAYGITFSGPAEKWTWDKKVAVLVAAYKVGEKLKNKINATIDPDYPTPPMTGAQAFRATYEYIDFTWETQAKDCAGILTSSGGCTYGPHNISFWSMSGQSDMDFDRMIKNVVHELGHAFYRATGSKALGDYFSRDALRPNPSGELDWQQQPGVGGTELFADTFIAWVYDAWNTEPLNIDKVNTARDAMNDW